MSKILIYGNKTLNGTIKISGAKNSAVAILPAALLSDEKVVINNVPNISDIDSILEILEILNVGIIRNDNTIILDPSTLKNIELPECATNKLRASYYFMSALLGKCKKVDMCYPGGCNISKGKRPIDQTLKAFNLLGATVEEYGNKYKIYAESLNGNKIELKMPSVGGTINSILAAVKAKGKTIIENAAREPEIVNVIDFLNKMGANILGGGTSTITIEGVNYLSGCSVDIIPDRIETGTYLIIGALIGKNLKIDNIISEHVQSLLDVFDEMGIVYKKNNNSIIINKSNIFKPVKIVTEGYPGFPTDLQQPITALFTQCDGNSKIEEHIWENRFKHVEYLNKMGANILIDEKNSSITIKGKTKLNGCEVTATDLRAGACMVIAGLIADGKTTINNVEHILRGYENIIEKLKNVGANIELIK